MAEKQLIKVPEHANGGEIVRGSSSNQVGDVRAVVNSLRELAKAVTETITDEELKELLPEEFEQKHRLFRLSIPLVLQMELWLNLRSCPLDAARLLMPWTQMYEVDFEDIEEEDEGWVDVKVTDAVKIGEDVKVKENEEDEGWLDVVGVEKDAKELVKEKLKRNLTKLQEPVRGKKVDLTVFHKLIDEW